MFELSEEHRMMLETVRRIATQEVKPLAAEIDETGRFPRETLELFSENGILTPLLPRRYGGIEAPFPVFSMMIEELARVCASSALILIAQADGMLPVLQAGDDAQRERFLPRLGNSPTVIAFAATEPSAGSDIISMQSRAVRDGDDYVIKGQKCFITNGSIADLITVFAYTEPERKAKGMSIFVVERGTAGLGYGREENKMGMRGSVNSELLFDDMRVPMENRIGGEGDGFGIMMRTLDYSRMFCASQAVGVAQGAIDEVIPYTQQRVQFGAPIANIQAVQFMIADMCAQTEAARLLVRKAAENLQPPPDPTARRFSALAKFFASDAAMKVTTDAVQVMGGYGYMKDFPVERMMRDAKLIQIYTGTNQVMRMVAGREILSTR